MFTPGFPPRFSGVGDHAARFAQAVLAAGDDVYVLTEGASRESFGVTAHGVGQTWTIGAAFRAVRTALNLRPDVFYIQYTPFAFGVRSFAPLMVATAGRTLRIPTGIYLHEAFYQAGSEAVSSSLKALLLSFRDAILVSMAHRVFVANEERKKAVARAVPWKAKSAIVVAPIGANIEPVPGEHWTARPPDSVTSLRLITFGIVAPRRRLELLIDAVAQLKIRGLDAHLRIIGLIKDEGYAQSLRDRALSANVGDKIEWSDRLEPSQVSEALRKADLFLFASTDGVTTSSSVFMVALAHGIPIINVATDKDDENFRSVLLPVSESGDSIADAVAESFSNLESSSRRGFLGLQLYEGSYTWRAMAKTICSALSDRP